ncbi:mitochondrial peptide methionine sulfoxide reductase isoform X2 [Poecilia reticulata]|uniref:mitochondrial peptide methionine sulfoxide reductase isoform X2 n=1 Tax=Poecilia reticulata TaxID=8081 RepID=UPI0007E992B7|nr:PREDICTED: mitochondrial peptide methionine sulfoxide reductase isoform X2 [Poecilia reticulata]
MDEDSLQIGTDGGKGKDEEKQKRLRLQAKHDVNGNRTIPPFPEGTQMVMFGMGCFWGAERKFWREKGVYSTQVGYSGGYTPNATYEEVCTGRTGHTEVVRVVYHPEEISFNSLLKVFWESHDPTQGMRQGNDVGTTYRSAIYAYTQQQLEEALASKDQYQKIPSLLPSPSLCFLFFHSFRPLISVVHISLLYRSSWRLLQKKVLVQLQQKSLKPNRFITLRITTSST